MRTIRIKKVREVRIRKPRIKGIKTKITIHEPKAKIPKIKMKRVKASIGLRKPHLRLK